MAKRDSAESLEILTEIIDLWVNGMPRKEIVQYCAENHKIAERQTDNYLAKAYKEIANNSKDHRGKLINQALRRYNDLYDRNLAVLDYKECRGVQDSICKLFGLNEAMKVDHTSNGQQINISPIEWVNGKQDQ